MNPLSINPLAGLASLAVAAALGFGSGWTVNGWRLNGEIQTIKAEHANDRATLATAAISDITQAAHLIKEAADRAQVDVSSLDVQLTAIRKDFKNANAKPLPADCRPDSPRVRKLANSAAAVDKAIAR
jgi:hypothetical protein